MGILAAMVLFPYFGFCLLMALWGSARALFSGHDIKLTFPNPSDVLFVALMIVVPIFCVFAFNALRQVTEAYDIVEKLYWEVKDKNRSDLSDTEARVVNLIGRIERERLDRLKKG